MPEVRANTAAKHGAGKNHFKVRRITHRLPPVQYSLSYFSKAIVATVQIQVFERSTGYWTA
jgi:hypothetical protein